MVHIDGINVPANVDGIVKIEINGAWITGITQTGKYIPIRYVSEREPDAPWYDEDHNELMDALHTIERMLGKLIG